MTQDKIEDLITERIEEIRSEHDGDSYTAREIYRIARDQIENELRGGQGQHDAAVIGDSVSKGATL